MGWLIGIKVHGGRVFHVLGLVNCLSRLASLGAYCGFIKSSKMWVFHSLPLLHLKEKLSLLWYEDHYMRPRARDRYTSSTLIGGKGGPGRNWLPTTLEGPTGVRECNMDVMSTYILTWHQMNNVSCHSDYFSKSPLEGRPNIKPGDPGTPNAHNHWYILFYHVWGPAWIGNHWNSIWLGTRSHMTPHYTRGSVTTLHDVGGVLGRPSDTFYWALAISWSRLLARVWSGPM